MYFLSILYITLLAILFKFAYPSNNVSSVITVLALLGLLLGWITNLGLSKIYGRESQDDS
jgi:hypothetical protein